MTKRGHRQRLVDAIHALYAAASDLKSIGYDPDARVSPETVERLRTAERHVDDIANIMRALVGDLPPDRPPQHWLRLK